MIPARFERATSAVGERHSAPLSYGTVEASGGVLGPGFPGMQAFAVAYRRNIRLALFWRFLSFCNGRRFVIDQAILNIGSFGDDIRPNVFNETIWSISQYEP